MDIVERLLEEENRHTIGYPGPRRNVASLLSDARDTITRLTLERDEARAKAIEAIAASSDTFAENAINALGVNVYRMSDKEKMSTAIAAAIRKLGETGE